MVYQVLLIQLTSAILLSHFGSQIDMTGKMFAVAESRELSEELKEGFEVNPETGAFVLKRNVTLWEVKDKID